MVTYEWQIDINKTSDKIIYFINNYVKNMKNM